MRGFIFPRSLFHFIRFLIKVGKTSWTYSMFICICGAVHSFVFAIPPSISKSNYRLNTLYRNLRFMVSKPELRIRIPIIDNLLDLEPFKSLYALFTPGSEPKTQPKKKSKHEKPHLKWVFWFFL